MKEGYPRDRRQNDIERNSGEAFRNRGEAPTASSETGTQMARRKKQEGVELNLAAMLDMAFQLLTFFILTFRPAPVEGQVDLRLPPPVSVTGILAADQPESLNVNVFSTPNGQIGLLAIGETNIPGLVQLESRLKTILADPGSPFGQVVIRAGSRLRYEELMRVIDVCARQKTADGSKLARLSFVELPE